MSSRTPTLQAAKRELFDCLDTDAPFEETAQRVLEVGAAYLGADNAHLARVDPVTDHWETLVSTDPDGERFPTGLELDLDVTYCRRTIEADGSIALHDAPAQGWGDDPAFETHGLHCYHGTTLRVNGEVYGTVCFVADDPRRAFSEAETTFAELLTMALGRELERDRHEAELVRQANLSTVLNRVLRHNIRNDLSVVRGFTQLMADELDDEHNSRPALAKIDSLLSLSEKARELDRTVTAEFEREPVDIVALVDDVVDSVASEHPAASIAVEANETVTMGVLPSLERALAELIENAAKHGGDAPTVTVSVDPVPTAVEITIADDGPGLADHERKVLEAGTETPLAHGTGLGLWLAHWIVTGHDGTIQADVTEDGTTMTVTIPRQPMLEPEREPRKLTRARDRYEAAFREAFDAMVIVDDDARIIDANPEASTVYGLDHLELLGRHVPDFLPEDFDFAAAWQSFKAAGSERDTLTIVGADGVDRPVEYAATTDIVPGQHLVIIRDLSEQIRRTRDLEETTRRLESLVEVAPAAIIEVDTDGVVRRWNAAAERVFGHESTDVIGRPIQDVELVPERDQAAFAERFDAVLDGTRYTDIPVERRRADGTEVRLRLSAVPVRNDEGAPDGILVIAVEAPDADAG